MSRILKAGKGLCATSLLFACLAPQAAFCRDAREVGDRLCRQIYEAPGIALALACDGFFGMRLNPEQGQPQDITGLWTLAQDAIELTLFTRQDQKLVLAVGGNAIHGKFAGQREASLFPAATSSATFTITGLLEKTTHGAVIEDAGSGKSFPIAAPADAKTGKFATAEITISQGKLQKSQIVAHSAPVPRFYKRQASRSNPLNFTRDVAGRYWLLPPMPKAETAALRFSPPNPPNNNGHFELSGPGIRLDGEYILAGPKLTLKASNANVRNLKLLGAEELAQAILGEFTWELSSRGLELNGARRLLLLENRS